MMKTTETVSYMREWFPVFIIDDESAADNCDFNVEIDCEELWVYQNKLTELLKLQNELEEMFKRIAT